MILVLKVDLLTKADIIFGSWERKDDFLFFNHVPLIAKQYVYYCRINAHFKKWKEFGFSSSKVGQIL